ncbi:MAG TPA: BlaI/MecI/CopY family transcriptional regulator [Allosphingosinicella sp.]|jgi:predicted transcriptional regulator
MIDSLPRREREIFEILCSSGKATAAQVRELMKNPPSYSAVRTMLARLEAKGLASHETVEQAYVYKSVPRPATVRDSALKQMVRTFFNGSAATAATALLGLTKSLSDEELKALERAIDQAKERQG